MINEQFINYLTNLYENIFEENVVNSKEFLTFVQDENLHPLRIKVEDIIIEIEQNIIRSADNSNPVITKELLDKMSLAVELDTFIMSYIENNNV